MEEHEVLVENAFRSRWSEMSPTSILSMNANNLLPELNNVIEGFEEMFTSITLSNENDRDSYNLLYVSNYNRLIGASLKSGRKIEMRDWITFRFTRNIESIVPQCNALTLFNSFQNKLSQYFESIGVLCVPYSIASLTGKQSFLVQGKKEADHVLKLWIPDLYKSYFERTSYSEDIESIQKIYLCYSPDDDKIKIGCTKNKLKVRLKSISEATKRSKKPMDVIIAAWNAPRSIEKELHSVYKDKRVRGEWFDLRALDLLEINKRMSEFAAINLGAINFIL